MQMLAVENQLQEVSHFMSAPLHRTEKALLSVKILHLISLDRM